MKRLKCFSALGAPGADFSGRMKDAGNVITAVGFSAAGGIRLEIIFLMNLI
jgi:hypothetical protein